MADRKQISQYKIGAAQEPYYNAIENADLDILDSTFQNQYGKLKALDNPVNISISDGTLVIEHYNYIPPNA